MKDEVTKEGATTGINRMNIDYLTLRKALGILGFLLPFALVVGNDWKIEESISHYYYTGMSVVFTSVLITFGLFLITYKGYPKEEGEIVSDNTITNWAGICAIIVALVPTACSYCEPGVPNGHDSTVYSTIHLVCAGLFITLMGFMAFNQFVKGEHQDAVAKRRKRLYRISGVVLWAVVAFLLIEMIIGKHFTPIDTFIGEAIALVFFGIAWLVKGETLEKIGL